MNEKKYSKIIKNKISHNQTVRHSVTLLYFCISKGESQEKKYKNNSFVRRKKNKNISEEFC